MNLGAGPVMMLAPELILQSFGPADDTVDLVAKEAQRWFGVMCFVFGGVYLGTMLFGKYKYLCIPRSSCLAPSAVNVPRPLSSQRVPTHRRRCSSHYRHHSSISPCQPPKKSGD